jgi:predicted metal-dependent hydrolase
MPVFLRPLGRLLKSQPVDLQPVELQLSQGPLRVTLRRNAQARRLVLRLSRDGSGAVLTVPNRIAQHRIMAFLEQSSAWLEAQLHRHKTTAAPVEAGKLLLQGELYAIVAPGGRRGLLKVDIELRTITVPGEAAHVERRLKDWLKARARTELSAASRRYAAAMQTSIGRVSVRDQKSRWGSCSASGDLSYSWRLIMAPPFVLDYVAAHEVAHRHHMNHGPRFWRLLMAHNPDVRAAKHWFAQHGPTLHHYLP